MHAFKQMSPETFLTVNDKNINMLIQLASCKSNNFFNTNELIYRCY